MTVKAAIENLQKALASQLGPANIVALTRLQYSPYLVTYRGQPLDQVLYFADLADGGKGRRI
jgi:hypothetical protein